MSKKDEEILGYSKGIPITQSVIDELAAEAERGYTPEQLGYKKRGRPTMGSGVAKTIQVKLSPELHKRLCSRVEFDQSCVSDVVRDALEFYFETA